MKIGTFESGAPSGTRTHDPLLRRQCENRPLEPVSIVDTGSISSFSLVRFLRLRHLVVVALGVKCEQTPRQRANVPRHGSARKEGLS